MDYVKKVLPSDVIGGFIDLPASMLGKMLEVIILPSENESVSGQLKGIAKTDITLEEARRERLAKYETTA